MKTYQRHLLVFCFALVGCATAWAQDAPAGAPLPPLPPGPLIQKRAPDPSQWVITTVITPVAPSTGATGNPTDASSVPAPQGTGQKPKWASQVTMTKTGKIMLRESLSPTGQKWTTWCAGGVQTTFDASGTNWMVQGKPNDAMVGAANYEDYSTSDFLGFDWISLKDYAGFQTMGGRKCIFFEDKSAKGTSARSAYIDLETRLPNTLKNGGETRTYVFNAPPTSELVLPPILVQLLANRQRELNSATPRSQTQ